MKQPPVYLDCNATTPVDPDLRLEALSWLESWGNPSSIHQFGRGPKKILREARRSLAKNLNVHPLELVFTSGGSEANNLAIQGLLRGLRRDQTGRKTLMVSAIEHPSVLVTMRAMGLEGYKVIEIPVDHQGQLDLDFYQKHLSDDVALVSIMIANNEVGVLNPLERMVALAHEVGAYFHTDCVQALGKIPLSLKALNVDLASFSSHKLYAYKGGGLLYIKKGTPLEPLIFGGAQERRRRAGTENLLSIASMAFMVEKLVMDSKADAQEKLRNQMEANLSKAITGVRIVAEHENRLPNTSSFTVNGVDGEALMMNLDIRGIAVSTGAACSSGNPEPSPVLLAMGLSREQAQSSLRVSLGRTTTEKDIQYFVETLTEVVSHLRKVTDFQGELNHG